jgi:hypothetical protein
LTLQCLVSFYGLNRSLRWTRRSIEKKIINPLRAAKISVRFCAHFNDPKTIYNEHSEELGITVTRVGINRLPLDYLLIEDQHEQLIPRVILDTIEYLHHGPRLERRETMLNLLFQLYSLNQLWRLVELTKNDFDFYIFVRPDMEYLDGLDVDSLCGQIINQNKDLITPSWGKWGGLNDRFAFCSRKGAEVYARRLACVERFCAERGYLHAEELLKSAAEWGNLQVGYTDMRAMRVRADGATIRGEFNVRLFEFVRGVMRKRIEKGRTTFGGSK